MTDDQFNASMLKRINLFPPKKVLTQNFCTVMYDTYTVAIEEKDGLHATVLPLSLKGMLTDKSLHVLWIDHNGPVGCHRYPLLPL